MTKKSVATADKRLVDCERRKFFYTAVIPERRDKKDRRKNYQNKIKKIA